MDLNELLLEDDRQWAAYAACKGADPDLFFPGPDDPAVEAKRICSACAVRQECLDWGFLTRAAYGVWGGTTEVERKRLLRKTG